MLTCRKQLSAISLAVCMLLGVVGEVFGGGGADLGENETVPIPKIVQLEMEALRAESAAQASLEAVYTQAMKATIVATAIAMTVVTLPSSISGALAIKTLGAAGVVIGEWAIVESASHLFIHGLENQLNEP